MKKLSNNKMMKFFALFFISVAFVLACNTKNDKTQDISYTCPMHPDIVKNEPGTCPVCGMDLVRQHKHEEGKTGKELDLSDTSVQGIAARIKVISPEEGMVSNTLNLKGLIIINTNQTKTLSSYINGRIEKLYIKYNFQKVSKGQKIMDIYSPELVAAQQELLYLKEAEDFRLMDQTKRKLRLLGVTDKEINKILSSGKPNYRIGIYSPFTGYIMDKAINPEDNTGTPDMPISIREGMYVKAGESFFRVYENSSVWAEFYASAEESKGLKTNKEITINVAGGKNISSKISSIQPFYKEGQNFTNIRVKLDNTKNEFRIGELVNGKIVSADNFGLWLPLSSVYQSGNRTIVFIRSGNNLYPKQISAKRIGDKMMVMDGLNKGDKIAENAAHLVDPEAFIYNNNENE